MSDVPRLPAALSAQSLGAASEIVFHSQRDERAWRERTQHRGPAQGYVPIAPHRWLLLDPDADAIEDATSAGGQVVDVEGKWAAFACAAAGALPALAAVADVGTVLERHGCAALVLFDCPALLARLGDGFLILVQASYAASFMDAWAVAAVPPDAQSNAGVGMRDNDGAADSGGGA
jgi:hypothetical protein